MTRILKQVLGSFFKTRSNGFIQLAACLFENVLDPIFGYAEQLLFQAFLDWIMPFKDFFLKFGLINVCIRSSPDHNLVLVLEALHASFEKV